MAEGEVVFTSLQAHGGKEFLASAQTGWTVGNGGSTMDSWASVGASGSFIAVGACPDNRSHDLHVSVFYCSLCLTARLIQKM